MEKFIVHRQQTSTGYWYKLYRDGEKIEIDECFDTIYGNGLDDTAPSPFESKSDWVNAPIVEGSEERYGAGWENVKYEIIL